MSTYNLGRILPIYRGEYEVGTTYNKLDIVYVSGYGSYVAKQTVSSVQPQENPEIWQLVAADCTNAELEETFNTNEAERENRVNTFISTKSQELATLIAEVNSEVDAKLGEVDSALDGIDGEWETMKNTMNNQFNSAQSEREADFTANEEQRESTLQNAISTLEAQDTTFKNSLQNETSEWLNEKTVEFNEAQTERATTFNQSMTSMNGQFNAAQAQRTTDFNTSETSRATTFTTNETQRQTTFDTNEASRQAEFDATEAQREEATQAIINEHDYLVNLDNTKANKDGYYSTLTTGAAENLVGDSVDSDTYLIRPTGGENNEVANGVASVLGMEGNSCVWNQLFSPRSPYPSSMNGISFTLNTDKSYTVVGTATARAVSTIGTDIPIHKNKIYIRFSKNGINLNVLDVYSGVFSINKSSILTAPSGRWDLGFLVSSGESSNYKVFVEIFDLTLLGIGNLTTVAQVEEWLAEHIGIKPYYAYNAGTILSAKTTGMKTYGQNLLNPTTKQAKLIPYTWEENSNVYTIKNVPSGATATFTPDNTGVAESVDVSGGSFDITNYGSGVLELSAATTNTYVCMKWDSTKDNDVVPYEEHTYNFDVTKVYGKVNGEGEYVQCFPNGMKSAGTIHDTLTASKAVVKVGSVDLGTLYWDKTADSNRLFSTHLPGYPSGSLYYNIPFNNKLCSKYDLFEGDVINCRYNNLQDKMIGIYTSGASVSINIKDDSHTASDLVSGHASWLEGVIFYYKLYASITYTNLIYRDNGVDTLLTDSLLQIDVDNWSIEEQTVQENSLPCTISTIYGINAVEALDTLQKSTYTESEIHSNFAALLDCINTNCSTILGGTFSVSDTATDKVFTFTFTQNEEGEGQ